MTGSAVASTVATLSTVPTAAGQSYGITASGDTLRVGTDADVVMRNIPFDGGAFMLSMLLNQGNNAGTLTPSANN